jgi:hypothetical protein
MRWLLAAVLALAGCASAQLDDAPSVTSGATTTLGPTMTTSPSTTTPTSPSTTASGREAAPDFTLALHGGGSYTLSDENRPVYLLFWAEW